MNENQIEGAGIATFIILMHLLEALIGKGLFTPTELKSVLSAASSNLETNPPPLSTPEANVSALHFVEVLSITLDAKFQAKRQ